MSWKAHKRVRVGRYILSGCAVEVWLTPADSSTVLSEWTKTGYGRIEIGTDTSETHSWAEIVQALLHEAGECAMHIAGCAYRRTKFMRLHESSSQNFRFALTHEEWQTVANEAGDFLCHALPDVAQEWNKLAARWKK